ncbi:MAG TPA: N-methyl-L-tryptophan oxidase [Chloroflexota bacterium]|nr:N-methyl-L-tryptophan oxidase [Chloroflexota bacterium]
MKYDAVVVGLGGLGSAAAFHLARRGRRVLGLDAFAPGHTRGSSHGESRIIRLAYHEHPDYVPLLRRAYELWEDLQKEAGTELLRPTGGLFVGPPHSPLVAGALESARHHHLPHEALDAPAIRRRFPMLRPAEGDVGVYEPRAGVLFPERCIEAHLHLARAAGAELRFEEPVRAWMPLDGGAGGAGVEVQTDRGRYRAARVVVTAGAWLGHLLNDLGLPLRPERNVVHWLRPEQRPEQFEPGAFPIFIWDIGAGQIFYGLPHLERPGVKVGLHHSGEWCDPDTVSREARPQDALPVLAFTARAIPDLVGPPESSVVCLYTNTPDGHFVVDRHPRTPALVFAGGTSGHGFKFCTVLGEVLADLATTGAATPAAGFLGLSRLTERA